ncbi:class I SAM-dependent methyltransferase [Jatrophihabitans fulvus]
MQADGLEEQHREVTELLFAAAAVAASEVVLDVGCGTGPTTRRAAAEAGPSGAVDGLDVAAAMLEAAARVPVPDGAAPITWIVADAVDWDAPVARYDLVLSRFGVMFFGDPAAAVGTLARATRPGGRFAAAVWAHRARSPLFEVPLQAAVRTLAGRGIDAEAPDPTAGPSSWHDPGKVTALLTGQGWRDVTLTPHELRMPFAGGLDAAAAARASLDFGPTQRLLSGRDDDTVAAVAAAIEAAFAEHETDGRVVLGATVQIVTARR